MMSRSKIYALVVITIAVMAPQLCRAGELSVNELNQQFSESEVTMRAGDVILFRNSDVMPHDIQITDSNGNTEDKGQQNPGTNTKVWFTTPGQYTVRCGIHESMRLKVTVK